MTRAEDERFRAGVGMLVLDTGGRALAIERADRPGAWQLPQGGLHVGEAPLAGAWRELGEETGLDDRHVELVAEHPSWLAYELPEGCRSHRTGLGQVQKWFSFRFHGADGDVRLPSDGEARAWGWKKLGDLAASTVEFRRSIYLELARWLDELSRQSAP
jgi:putative (di)nucleoside polyphosphate hydrolase